jgi:acid stress-induced BolA-like protein IbaG/YrbA
MDVKEKVRSALVHELDPEHVRLEDDDGISGFVVSRRFTGMSSFDRQGKIEETLDRASLAADERRQVLMIAGLTPDEYAAIGARVRVHKVKETAGGALEISLHGGLSDAEYVRGTLRRQKGVRTTDPKSVPGPVGGLMVFRAHGTKANPLTKVKAIRILKKDPYIEVMSNQ